MLHYRLLYNRFILFPQLEYNDTHYIIHAHIICVLLKIKDRPNSSSIRPVSCTSNAVVTCEIKYFKIISAFVDVRLK